MFAAERDRSVEKMSGRLADLDVKIASLRTELAARSSASKAEASSALSSAVSTLEAQRVAAGEALSDAKTATRAHWKQVESKSDDSLEQYRRAYDAAKRELER